MRRLLAVVIVLAPVAAFAQINTCLGDYCESGFSSLLITLAKAAGGLLVMLAFIKAFDVLDWVREIWGKIQNPEPNSKSFQETNQPKAPVLQQVQSFPVEDKAKDEYHLVEYDEFSGMLNVLVRCPSGERSSWEIAKITASDDHPVYPGGEDIYSYLTSDEIFDVNEEVSLYFSGIESGLAEAKIVDSKGA